MSAFSNLQIFKDALVETGPAMWQRIGIATGITPPKITFGVEMEMIYVFRKERLSKFLEENHAELDWLSGGKFKFLCAIINGQEPPSARRKLLAFNDCKVAEVYGDTTYDTWQIVHDPSAFAQAHDIASFVGLAEWQSHFDHQDGVELISVPWQVPLSSLDIKDIRNLVTPLLWKRDLAQIEKHVIKNTEVGNGFCNNACGLHVHFSLPGFDEPPLKLTMQLVLLWAMCEPFIETLHPPHRRAGNNRYAQSLMARSILSGRGWTEFSAGVYAAQSVHRLTREILPVNSNDKFQKVHFSPERDGKRWTIEFREHRGTLHAAEVLHWATFCRKMVEFSWILATHNYVIEGNEIRDAMQLLDVIKMEDEGKQFYREKVEEYQN